MAKRRRIQRRAPVEEYDDDVEDVDDDVEDDDDVEEVEQPKRTSKPAVAVARKAKVVDDDLDDDDLEDDDDAPPPKAAARKVVPPPVKKTALPIKPVAKPAATVQVKAQTPAVPIKVQRVADDVAGAILTGLLEEIEQGKSVLITRTGDGKWTFSGGAAAVTSSGPKLKNKEYWDTVLTNEYKAWQSEWTQLTYAEKKAKAKKMGVRWESHEDERVDNIRISAAVMAKQGIEKYKEEYKSRSAQAKLKG